MEWSACTSSTCPDAGCRPNKPTNPCKAVPTSCPSNRLAAGIPYSHRTRRRARLSKDTNASAHSLVFRPARCAGKSTRQSHRPSRFLRPNRSIRSFRRVCRLQQSPRRQASPLSKRNGPRRPDSACSIHTRHRHALDSRIGAESAKKTCRRNLRQRRHSRIPCKASAECCRKEYAHPRPPRQPATWPVFQPSV